MELKNKLKRPNNEPDFLLLVDRNRKLSQQLTEKDLELSSILLFCFRRPQLGGRLRELSSIYTKLDSLNQHNLVNIKDLLYNQFYQ